jgi:hypothetical protein
MDFDDNGPELEEALSEPVDFKPLLTRRFTWDTLPCSQVAELLPKLGLVVGSEEGIDIEHRESHARMAKVFPLEKLFQAYSEILGVVLTTALTHNAGVELPSEDSVGFAAQNAEVVLCSARAIVAQLMCQGVLTYGPAAVPVIQVTEG